MADLDNEKMEFDHSGQYESGLKSLVHSLRLAFFFLLVLIIGMLIYFFTLGGYVEARPQEAVIVLRFGQFHDTFNRGWAWYVPYPATKFVVVRTSPQMLRVNFTASTSEVGGGAAERALEPGRDAYLMTGDANIVHDVWQITYQITDPLQYYRKLQTPDDPRDLDVIETEGGYTGSRGPRTFLTNLFRQAVVQVTASEKVDGLLYDKKADYRGKVQSLFDTLVTDAQCGIAITGVSLEEVTPPAKTKAAFDEVAAASNTKDSMINGAREYEVKTLNHAESERVTVLTEATTYSKQLVAEVKAGSLYFESIQKAYLASPDTVLMSLYNYTISDVLTNQDGKFILGTTTAAGRKQIRLKINQEPVRKAAAGQATEEKK